MKNVLTASFLALLISIGLACGSSKSSSTQTTDVSGSWVVTMGTGEQIHATLVPNGTADNTGSVTSCHWGLSNASAVTGPECFSASSDGVGSLSDTNGSIQPQILVVGVSQNPAPDGAAVSFSMSEFYFDGFVNNYWFVRGNGTLKNGGIQNGSYSCNEQETPSCAGLSGTFTASR